jgi:hypothetical protein
VLAGIGLALAFLSPADRASQRTSCQSRIRRPMRCRRRRGDQARNEMSEQRTDSSTDAACGGDS